MVCYDDASFRLLNHNNGKLLSKMTEDDELEPPLEMKQNGFKRKSSIFMPKALSRIWLEITGIRVERVQDISEDDAKAEGVEESGGVEMKDGSPCYSWPYRELWDRLHGVDNPKAWEANPFVWVIEFKKVNK
jgi:hypothetical protein